MLIERATGLGFPPLPGHLLAVFVAHALSLGDLDVIKAVADIAAAVIAFVSLLAF